MKDAPTGRENKGEEGPDDGGRRRRERNRPCARFVYLFVSRNGESAKRHRSLMQIDNSVTRFTRLPRQPPVKFQSRPSFARSLPSPDARRVRARDSSEIFILKVTRYARIHRAYTVRACFMINVP